MIPVADMQVLSTDDCATSKTCYYMCVSLITPAIPLSHNTSRHSLASRLIINWIIFNVGAGRRDAGYARSQAGAVTVRCYEMQAAAAAEQQPFGPTAAETYLFDLQGFLLLPAVLSPSEVVALRTRLYQL